MVIMTAVHRQLQLIRSGLVQHMQSMDLLTNFDMFKLHFYVVV